MQFEEAQMSTMPPPVPLRLRGLALGQVGFQLGDRRQVLLRYAAGARAAAEPPEPGPCRVVCIGIEGLRPERLWGLVVFDGEREALRFDSLTGRAGQPLIAGDMLVAMSRLSGEPGLALDTRGTGVRLEQLQVQLLVDGLDTRAELIRVLARLAPAG